MRINIKATELTLTPSIKTYIEEKIGSLSKFLGKFDQEGAVETWVEIARTTKHHHKGLVFRAEADIRLPGRVIRGEREDTDIRKAIYGLKQTLRLELAKYRTVHLLRRIIRRPYS